MKRTVIEASYTDEGGTTRVYRVGTRVWCLRTGGHGVITSLQTRGPQVKFEDGSSLGRAAVLDPFLLTTDAQRGNAAAIERHKVGKSALRATKAAGVREETELPGPNAVSSDN